MPSLAPKSNNRATGGELLARCLAEIGVREAFVLHGGHLDALLVACPDWGIRLTDCRHEAAAGHAADGFVRAGGGPLGVCVVTAGPGFTNALTPMTNAYLDGVATLFVVGAPPLREAETNPLQGGFDQIAMATPVTKWAHRVTHAERIPDLVRTAVRIATTGRPGPVLLELPIDVMFMPTDPARADWRGGALLPAPPAPSGDAVSAILDLLQSAERPVILAGGGVAMSSSAARDLARFAALTGTPVTHNYRALGVMPWSHPANVGGVGTLAAAAAKGAVADTVLILGARRGMFLGGRGAGVIPEQAAVAQIDLEPSELGRLGPVSIGVVADCGEALKALIGAAQDRSWPDRASWTATLMHERGREAELWAAAPADTPSGKLHPFHAAKAVAEALPTGAVTVLDGGEAASWFSGLLRPEEPGLFMATGYLGCLGVAPGFAIGAQRAHPDRLVVSITGDGGLGFNVQEFDTMVRHDLPILTVVMNNACWGMSQSGQDIVYGPNRRTAVALADTNYDKVAVAFGGCGERIQRHADIRPAVERAIASGRPACLNLITDPAIPHPITAGLVGDVSQPGAILIPYYENILLET